MESGQHMRKLQKNAMRGPACSCEIDSGHLLRSFGKLSLKQILLMCTKLLNYVIRNSSIYIDAPILRMGLVLVDLPGKKSICCVWSTFHG